MFVTLTHLLTLVRFVRWLIPTEGHSPRFYISLLNILVLSRQSVYRHFRELKADERRVRFNAFLSALASIPDPRQSSVPATLLARLLRTIYLTELAPRKKHGKLPGGPNQGYIDHPYFSYGDSLQKINRQESERADLP